MDADNRNKSDGSVEIILYRYIPDSQRAKDEGHQFILRQTNLNIQIETAFTSKCHLSFVEGIWHILLLQAETP